MSDRDFHISTLAVIGVGLIGGSLATALKKRGCVDRVVGVGRSQASLETAKSLGVIDEIADSPAATAQADVILLATPVNSMAQVFKQLSEINSDAIITDVGSVKVGVMESAKVLGNAAARFVPAHPIAGKEHSGVAAASADLFDKHNVVLTPTSATDEAAVQCVSKMWSAVGANVLTMDAQAHDEMLSVTSHLPHLLAYAMVDFFAACDARNEKEMASMVAGGFSSFTRTASSDVEMWRDIFLMNNETVAQHLDEFIARLQTIRAQVQAGDGDALEKLFADAKKTRAKIK